MAAPERNRTTNRPAHSPAAFRRYTDGGADDAPPLSAREAVIASIQAKRDEEANDNYEVANDNDDPDDEDIVENTERDEQRRHTLRVDHRDVELTDEELYAAARQHLAAENRLTELNALKQQTAAQLAEIRQLKDNLGVRADSTSPQRTTAPPNANAGRDTPPKARGELLREVAEKLQIGDADEGAQALASLLEGFQPQQGPSPEEIANRALALSEERAAQRVAGETFAAEHREIASDPILYRATISRLHENIVEDMRRIGVRPEHLQQATADFEVASLYHEDLRVKQGYALQEPDTLVEYAARDIEDRYVPRYAEQQEPAPPQQDRFDDRRAQKRDLSGSQPRRVSAVARREVSTEKRSTGSVVEQMRRQRGHI